MKQRKARKKAAQEEEKNKSAQSAQSHKKGKGSANANGQDAGGEEAKTNEDLNPDKLARVRTLFIK